MALPGSGMANWGRRVAKAGRTIKGATGAAGGAGSFGAMRGPRASSLNKPFNLPVLGRPKGAPRFSGGALPKRVPGATMGAGFPRGPLALGAGPAARAPGPGPSPIKQAFSPPPPPRAPKAAAAAAASSGGGGGLPRGVRALGSRKLGNYHKGARQVRGGIGINTHRSPEFDIGHDLGSRNIAGRTARKTGRIVGGRMGGDYYKPRPSPVGPRPGAAHRPPPGTHAPPPRPHARPRGPFHAPPPPPRGAAHAPPRAQRPPPRAPSPSRGLVVPGNGRAAPSSAIAPAHRPPPPSAPSGTRSSLDKNAKDTSNWLLRNKYKIAAGGLASVAAAGFMSRRGPGTGESSGGVPTGMYGY